MNQRIRLRPASPASPGSPAGPRWFQDGSRMIKVSESSPGPSSRPLAGRMKPRISRKPLWLLYLLVECMGSVRYKSLETLRNIVTFMIFVVSRKNICFFICFNVIIWCAGIFAGDRWQNQKKMIPDDFGTIGDLTLPLFFTFVYRHIYIYWKTVEVEWNTRKTVHGDGGNFEDCGRKLYAWWLGPFDAT